MNSDHRLRLFSILLLTSLLLLTPFQLRAQKDSDAGLRQSMLDSASLSVHIDPLGAGRVDLQLPLKVNDLARLQRSMADSFSFPLQFEDNTKISLAGDSDEDEEGVSTSWTNVTGKGARAFPDSGMKSTCRIDLRPLIGALRSLGLRHLKIRVAFQTANADIDVKGATRLRTTVANSILAIIKPRSI